MWIPKWIPCQCYCCTLPKTIITQLLSSSRHHFQDSSDSSCYRLQLAAGAGSQCVPQECIQVTAWLDCPRTLPAMAQVRSAFPPAPRSMRSDASAPLWRLHVWRRGLLADRTPDDTVGGETLTVYLIYSISGYTSSPRREQTEAGGGRRAAGVGRRASKA